MTPLYLIEDAPARGWSPFAETRPVGELRFGDSTLRERALRLFGVDAADYLGPAGLRHDLDGFSEPGAGSIAAAPAVAPEGGCRLWLSRAVAEALPESAGPVDAPLHWTIGGEVVGLALPAGTRLPALDRLAPPEGSRDVPVAGRLLAGPWELVEHSADRLRADLAAPGGGEAGGFAMSLPDGVFVQGPPLLLLADDVEIGPGVVLDTRDGPIRLDAGCVVEGPARLVGPLHLGAGCVVFGGHLARVTAGPVCKLRGEIADAVICGYSNKAHDGYLGHALLGRWVNLGAGTTNSDLKNNYSPVRVTTGSGTHDTGLVKVGVFLGDHVKTGIGTMLNTGTAIGAGSNVFGGGMPPKWVAPFSWSWPKGNRPFRFDRFEEIARIVTARRGQAWPDGMNALFRRLHERVHPRDPNDGATDGA